MRRRPLIIPALASLAVGVALGVVYVVGCTADDKGYYFYHGSAEVIVRPAPGKVWVTVVDPSKVGTGGDYRHFALRPWPFLLLTVPLPALWLASRPRRGRWGHDVAAVGLMLAATALLLIDEVARRAQSVFWGQFMLLAMLCWLLAVASWLAWLGVFGPPNRGGPRGFEVVERSRREP